MQFARRLVRTQLKSFYKPFRQHSATHAIAAYVCFIYSVLDRLADVFDFELEPPEKTSAIAEHLFNAGYAGSAIPETDVGT